MKRIVSKSTKMVTAFLIIGFLFLSTTGRAQNDPPTLVVDNIIAPTTCDGSSFDGSFDVTVMDDCGASYSITSNGITYSGVPAGTTINFCCLSGGPSVTTYNISIGLDDSGMCLFSDPTVISSLSDSVEFCPPPPAPPIPTLGEWGLIILGLSFIILGLVAFRIRDIVVG